MVPIEQRMLQLLSGTKIDVFVIKGKASLSWEILSLLTLTPLFESTHLYSENFTN